VVAEHVNHQAEDISHIRRAIAIGADVDLQLNTVPRSSTLNFARTATFYWGGVFYLSPAPGIYWLTRQHWVKSQYDQQPATQKGGPGRNWPRWLLYSWQVSRLEKSASYHRQ